MTSNWQDVYDKVRCAKCGAATGQPCRRGSGYYEATVPHAARRRAATGLASFSGDAARAAGWVPVVEVLDALRDEPPEAYSDIAAFVADRFGTKEQP